MSEVVSAPVVDNVEQSEVVIDAVPTKKVSTSGDEVEGQTGSSQLKDLVISPISNRHESNGIVSDQVKGDKTSNGTEPSNAVDEEVTVKEHCHKNKSESTTDEPAKTDDLTKQDEIPSEESSTEPKSQEPKPEEPSSGSGEAQSVEAPPCKETNSGEGTGEASTKEEGTGDAGSGAGAESGAEGEPKQGEEKSEPASTDAPAAEQSGEVADDAASKPVTSPSKNANCTTF